MRKAKTAADEEISFAEAFAILKPVVEKALAERPPSPEPAPAWRAETAAERDLFRAEMACRIQAVICSNPARCAKHACRRLRHCPELEDCQRLVEEQRALVARERAALPAADAAMPLPPDHAADRTARGRTKRRRRR
jgi:hypothetical protein